jgi:hypothetical protein
MTASLAVFFIPPLWRNGSVASTGFDDGRHILIGRKIGRSRLRRIVAVPEGEPDNVVADVFGPGSDQFAKPPAVVREQSAGSFLEAFEIAGHRRHEMIGRIPRGAMTIAIATGASRLIDEFS